jgi:3-phenylpropionate/cinnamic acid dioxygenase small subunit
MGGTVTDPARLTVVEQLLFREARLLDTQCWREWADLYCDDAVFWVPAVTMSGMYTSEPQQELNFIYIEGRAGLEARIFRIESGASLASNPLPRTRHLVTSVTIDDDRRTEIRTSASFQVVTFSEARGQQIRTGAYEHVLRDGNGRLRIAQKKILLLEYVIDGYFDFFNL